MSRILGIDLGTTNSCMAVMEGRLRMVNAGAPGQASLNGMTVRNPTLSKGSLGRHAVAYPVLAALYKSLYAFLFGMH